MAITHECDLAHRKGGASRCLVERFRGGISVIELSRRSGSLDGCVRGDTDLDFGIEFRSVSSRALRHVTRVYERSEPMTSKRTTRKGDRFAQDRGMVDRLQDQLKIQKKVAAIHLNRRLLDEMAFYPAHDKRTETPEYKQAHHHLTVELDLPCLICGVKNSALKGPENHYHAKQMETHHHVVEWALANAIDTNKFNSILLPHLAHRHQNNPDYQKPFTQEQIRDWVDHSEDNLWVLCDVHHRAQFFGVHEITFPIWSPMNLLRDDFEAYVNEQVAKEKGPAKRKKGAPKKRRARK
jgi:hypothetical protein